MFYYWFMCEMCEEILCGDFFVYYECMWLELMKLDEENLVNLLKKLWYGKFKYFGDYDIVMSE